MKQYPFETKENLILSITCLVIYFYVAYQIASF